jgi:hypothetical protein
MAAQLVGARRQAGASQWPGSAIGRRGTAARPADWPPLAAASSRWPAAGGQRPAADRPGCRLEHEGWGRLRILYIVLWYVMGMGPRRLELLAARRAGCAPLADNWLRPLCRPLPPPAPSNQQHNNKEQGTSSNKQPAATKYHQRPRNSQKGNPSNNQQGSPPAACRVAGSGWLLVALLCVFPRSCVQQMPPQRATPLSTTY